MENFKGHKIDTTEVRPVVFTGSIKDTSKEELMKYGREVAYVFAQVYPTRDKHKLDKMNEAIIEKDNKKVGFKGFTPDGMQPLEYADQYKEVEAKVSNQSVKIHESMDTLDYTFDMKVVGTTKNGSKEILTEETDLQFEIYKSDENILKILGIEVLQKESKGVQKGYEKIDYDDQNK